MRMADIIEHKKQGLALTKEEIDFFVKNIQTAISPIIRHRLLQWQYILTK